ncbi:glycosyltransferase family 2 protein [Chloroflexota bacterium]
MSSKPLVSIITPSYNQAAYIEDTIQSVLAQDYTPIEYIIVDGASTDGSQEIIKRYEKQLSWWISEPDAGQAEAINKGFNQAQGEIIAWLNSDDLYLFNAVSAAADSLVKNPDLGLVFGNAMTIDTNGRPLNKLVFGDWGLKELLSYRIICQPAVFIRREILDQAGYLDPSFHFMLDHQLWIRIAMSAPIQYINPSSNRDNPGLWAAARHHPTAKNVAQAEGFSIEAFRLMAWMKSQPELAPLLNEHKNNVYAGLYRLSGRYLLDGGLPGRALKAYMNAFLRNPSFTLKHWHRILYAAACTVGLESVADSIYQRIPKKYPNLEKISGLTGWPGLFVDDIN